MKLLKQFIAIHESKRHGFHDVFFIDLVEQMRHKGQLPKGTGHAIAYGNEAIIYSFGPDKVIRLHPTYEMHPEQVQEVLERYKRAASGDMFVKIFKVGDIPGRIEGDDLILAVYVIMERLDPIDYDEASIIDKVIMKRADIKNLQMSPKLKDFLLKYQNMKIDLDSNNVMMRNGEYVITDPE